MNEMDNIQMKGDFEDMIETHEAGNRPTWRGQLESLPVVSRIQGTLSRGKRVLCCALCKVFKGKKQPWRA